MAQQDSVRKAETEVGADDARKGLTELMGRAAFGNERIVLTRNGKPSAAIIGMDDLERLRQLDAA